MSSRSSKSVLDENYASGLDKLIDRIHTGPQFEHEIYSQQLVEQIWYDKYRQPHEASRNETFKRVALAIYSKDNLSDVDKARQEAYDAMCLGLWMPGGRIIAGAGTSKRVTLMNCYVLHTLEDSLGGIMEGLKNAALTQQQGGGIGQDFSTLRPSGAVLHRTGSAASGPLPFMDMWDSMCATIMSAGDRRGAMMATMCDTHPDLPLFIKAKHQKGRLTNFNVSVLVSDALMAAVEDNEDWVLHFHTPPLKRNDSLKDFDFEDDEGTLQYAYAVWKARELWELILNNTFEYSEPGVIFIDRINDLNNLKYCEEIRCTNPCGEQPLPPNGTCNLGAINLSKVVLNPFRSDARINMSLLSRLTHLGVRFLDNVIDVANYPLVSQAEEEGAKRRIGLGVSGLADCLAQLNIRYGSAQAVQTTEAIFKTICEAAYSASATLSRARGSSFPMYDGVKYFDDTFASRLPAHLRSQIDSDGMRNGVLLTIAPTGTTSILFGNISSGIEPVFAHKSARRVRQKDNTFKEYTSFGFNYLLWTNLMGESPLPPAMVTVEDLTVENHIVMQAAAQRYVDASISKTINCPKDITFEQFKKAYDLAYALGCKGCTTYRPSDVRGSILSKPDESGSGSDSSPPPQSIPQLEVLEPRDEILQGITHKVKWPSMTSAFYITINSDSEGLPYEVFFNSKDSRFHEWMTALSLMISAILRKGDGDVSFIAKELGSVHSVYDTAWIKIPGEERPKFFGSLIAFIGYILGKDFAAMQGKQFQQVPTLTNAGTPASNSLFGERCPQCFAPALEYKEGCKICSNCGFSDCQ